MWGVFTFYMWVGSLPLNRALQSVLLALWITFFLLGGADLFGIPLLHTAGGYVGLITAVLAFYLAAAEIINETHGREVLPIGAPAAQGRITQAVENRRFDGGRAAPSKRSKSRTPAMKMASQV